MADSLENRAAPLPGKPPAAPAARSFARSRPFGALVAVSILIVAGAVAWFVVTRNRESTDDAQMEAYVTQIAARVGGTALRVRVGDNQQVDAGSVLVEI